MLNKVRLPEARMGDPDTSHEAAKRLDQVKFQAASDTVLDLYREHLILADFQLKPLFDRAFGVDCSPHLYRQARSAMRDAGHIKDGGLRIDNPKTNREQIVWEYLNEPIKVEIEKCPVCGHVLGRTSRKKG